MGDFERTFGAGADAGAIIDFYSLTDNEDEDTGEEILASGKVLPRAKSFFDLTGQVWYPGSDARARIAPEQLAEIDRLASSTAEAFCKEGAIFHRDWNEIAELFLAHIQPTLECLSPSLDAYETFLSAVVRQVCVPIVFARDTGPQAGYVSPTLSTHVLAFPEEVYLARFGGLSFGGPYSDFKSFGGFAVLEIDSFRGFAKEGQGREVLEISPELHDQVVPIRDVRDWVEAEKGSSGGSAHNSFETLARRAKGQCIRCRIWSDADEDTLCAKVRGIIAGILPPSASARVTLNLHESEGRLSANVFRMQVSADEDLLHDLVEVLMERLNLAVFRGAAPSITILEDTSFSLREREAGKAVLLDFINSIGADVSAAADALEREDYKCLYEILSPDAFDSALRSLRSDALERAASSPEAALARHGMEITDLPF